MVLECRGLTCGYHGCAVLEGIHLQVRAGESVALLGPNGSGKSTLLRTVAKNLAPMEGDVLLGRTSTRSMGFGEIARRVAYVPQEETTDFPFLVREIVAMGRLPYAKGLRDTEEDLEATEEALRTADCLALANRPITELSGGERQRVLIARALAQGAPLLLLDEPTSHLDVRHQLEVARLLRRLAEAGKTVVTAVHDLNLAAQIADRAILLGSRRVLLDAPLVAVLRDPILDRVYGVRFDRVEDPLRVYGRLDS